VQELLLDVRKVFQWCALSPDKPRDQSKWNPAIVNSIEKKTWS
jgi:hypothetical protein